MSSSESTHNETAPTAADAGKPARSLALRCLTWGLIVVAALLLTAVLMLSWLMKTETGSRLLLSSVAEFSLGTLEVHGVQGTLGDRLDIEALKIHTAGLQVEASGLQMQWRPLDLWKRQLNVDSLHISALTIASKSSTEPAKLPASLSLPLAVQAKDLALGRLLIADLLNDGQRKEVLTLSALSGALSYQQAQYRARLALSSPWGQGEISAGLHSRLPYLVEAQAKLSGQQTGDLPAVTANLLVSGNLQELKLALSGMDARSATQQALFSGTADAVIAPFSAQILRTARIDLQHLNPQAWTASAPHADLSVKADVRTVNNLAQKNLQLTGEVRIRNTVPGPWNLQRLPVEALQTQISSQGLQWQLQGMDIKLAGNGQVRGQAQLNLADKTSAANAQLQLSRLDFKRQSLGAGPVLTLPAGR